MKKVLKIILIVLIIMLVGFGFCIVYENVFNTNEEDSEIENNSKNDYVKADDITLSLEMDDVIVNKDAPNNKIRVIGNIELSFDSDKYMGVVLTGYCLGSNGEKYLVHSDSPTFYNSSITDLVLYEDIRQDVEYTDGTKKSWDDVDWSNVKITYCKLDKLDAVTNSGEDNYKDINFEKGFSELDIFLDTLNNDDNGDKEVSYKNLTIKYTAPKSNIDDGFQGIKFYKGTEEILSLASYGLYNSNFESSSKAVLFNETDKVFFVNMMEWGAHKPTLLVISEDGDIIFNKGWKEGNISIDSENWQVTVNYYTISGGGDYESMGYTKEDISSGTIVYQYSNNEMKIIKDEYKTFEGKTYSNVE